MGDTTIRRGKATVTLIGFSALYARLKKVSPRVQEIGVSVLNRQGAAVFAQSQELVPVSPVDGGELKASGRFYRARVSPRSGRVYATITYGGARLAKLAPGDSPIYAIVQHENLTQRHTHGQAKFLERPYLASKAGVMADLKQAIAQEVNRGFS